MKKNEKRKKSFCNLAKCNLCVCVCVPSMIATGIGRIYFTENITDLEVSLWRYLKLLNVTSLGKTQRS